MENEDKLYRFMREIKRLQGKQCLSEAGAEQLAKPLAGMNEKQQDEYAQEMISVLKSSQDEAEMLLRSQMCLQLMAEGAVMEGIDEPQAGDTQEEREYLPLNSLSPDEGASDLGVYLSEFMLPIRKEEQLLAELGAHNGGAFGYVDNPYPCGLFSSRELERITFQPITVFYGGNGSGKSTLLNLIANRLELNRVAPYNSGEMFDRYKDACAYLLGHDEEGFSLRIPSGSRIITSDDVFDYMLTMRTRNEEISEDRQEAGNSYAGLKFGESVKFRGMEDYEALRLQVLARSKSVSRRQFIRRTAGEEVPLCSNGETALHYFRAKVKSKTLYCLDEPENSLSPAKQLELAELLEKRAYEEECQLILATHSPFLLAMKGARVYDLDTAPVRVRPWWKLEHSRIYYDFFQKHRKLFEIE